MKAVSVSRLHFHNMLIGLLVFLLVLGTIVVSFQGTDGSMDSCTIFSISRDGRVFFCDNEDENLRHGRIWFLPGTPGQFGLVLFCYGIHRNVMIPIGGMNDQGLCLDGTVVSDTEIHRDPSKPDYLGTFSLDLLRVCATVEDAKAWVQSYNLLMLHWQQVHIADRTGDMVVVGLADSGKLWLTNKSAEYLISVPVNHAQSTHGFGERYDRVEAMLNVMGELTLEGCQMVLETAAVPATMFSYICDQQNGILYLYSRGDFDRIAVLNVTEELAKGEHSYDIERLVSQQTGAPSPADTLNENLGILCVGSITIFSLVIVFVMVRRRKPIQERLGKQ
ncbi:MAG: hypothetical protein ACFFCF_08800 [Promethearchaeota archaeon]